jgi:hypothetical protein
MATRTATKRIAAEHLVANYKLICNAVYAAQRLNALLGDLDNGYALHTLIPITVRTDTVYQILVELVDVDVSHIDVYVPDTFQMGGVVHTTSYEDTLVDLTSLCRALQTQIDERDRKKKREDDVINLVRSKLSPEDLEVLRAAKHRL